MANHRNSGKSVEGFVQWKEPSASGKEVGSNCDALIHGPVGKGRKKVNQTSSHSRHRVSTDTSDVGRGRSTMGARHGHSGSGVGQPSSSRGHSNTEKVIPQGFKPPRAFSKDKSGGSGGTASWSSRVEGRQGTRTGGAGNGRVASPLVTHGFKTRDDRQTPRQVAGSAESPVRSVSRGRPPTGPSGDVIRPQDVGSPDMLSVEKAMEYRWRSRSTADGQPGYSADETPSRRTGEIGNSGEVEVNTSGGVWTAEEEEEYDESNEADGKGGAPLSPPLRRTGNQGLTYLNDNPDDNESDGDEERRTASDEEFGVQGRYDLVLQEGALNNNESNKRRERRQAQATREREGQRRRKEGKKRNFLLVDEHSMKPYGVGKGDWRKELMLLSRNLDPAIGNINQQSEAAVLEIADWIQETWEYSLPIKFAYVKEVVARGVTLRRAELWKMIRNNEDKPDKLSDRSWKILERQLESPATLRKSESCRRANASRVNFGRTGPSGEVGVRERLRRRLRRSPDPEEIRFEMARDKGYNGRSQAQKRKREEREALEDVQGSHGGTLSSSVEGRQTESLSVEQIAQHPLVISLMQRLEALEGGSSKTVGGADKTGIDVVSVQVEQDLEGIANEQTEEVEGSEEFLESGVLRRSGRTRKTRQ